MTLPFFSVPLIFTFVPSLSRKVSSTLARSADSGVSFRYGCVPCQALMPFVHEMADKYGDKLKFCALNTTKARRLAIGLKVLGLPTMAIFKGGEKVEELVKDDATPENIEALIKKYLPA